MKDPAIMRVSIVLPNGKIHREYAVAHPKYYPQSMYHKLVSMYGEETYDHAKGAENRIRSLDLIETRDGAEPIIPLNAILMVSPMFEEFDFEQL